MNNKFLANYYSHNRLHKRKLIIRLILIFFIPFVNNIVLTHYDCLHAKERGKPRILIIPMKAKGGISQDSASLLTDLLAVLLHKTERFIILNREDMKDMLTEKEFEMVMGCNEDNICLLKNVEKLAVNKIVAGSIGAVGEKYYVSIRLINDSGQNEIMVEDRCECTLEELDRSIERIEQKFLNYLDKKGEKKKTLQKAITTRNYINKDGSTGIIASAKGTSIVKNNVINARIMAEKNAIKIIKIRLINVLTNHPYNLNINDAINVFEKGEIIEIEYQNDEDEKVMIANVKYRIKLPI